MTAAVRFTPPALDGAATAGSLRVIGTALVHLGVPVASTATYEGAIEDGRFVLIAHGTSAQVERARGARAPVPHDTLESHPSRFA